MHVTTIATVGVKKHLLCALPSLSLPLTPSRGATGGVWEVDGEGSMKWALL